MLFCILEKRFLCQCGSCQGRHTIDKIIEVFNWSMKLCWLGTWPKERHDNTPFRADEQQRSHLKGKLGFRQLVPSPGGLGLVQAICFVPGMVFEEYLLALSSYPSGW